MHTQHMLSPRQFVLELLGARCLDGGRYCDQVSNLPIFRRLLFYNFSLQRFIIRIEYDTNLVESDVGYGIHPVYECKWLFKYSADSNIKWVNQ